MVNRTLIHLLAFILVIVNASYTNLVEGEVAPNSLLSRLTPKKTFRMIELIKVVDACQGCRHPEDFKRVISKNTRIPYDFVQSAFRNESQLSGILFRKGENKFYVSFIGCQGIWDIAKCSKTHKNIVNTVVLDYLLLPFAKAVRVFDENFNRSYSDSLGVQCHGGIESISTAIGLLAETIRVSANPKLPVLIKIAGHSLGGALAFHAALYLRMKLAPLLFPENPSKLHLQVVAFAPAGFFTPEGVVKAGEIIGEDNCVTFGHPDDFAMWFASFSDFYNPGIHVKLPSIKWEFNVLPSIPTFVGHMSQRYYDFIREWKDPGLLQFEKRRLTKATMEKWSAYLDSHRPKEIFEENEEEYESDEYEEAVVTWAETFDGLAVQFLQKCTKKNFDEMVIFLLSAAYIRYIFYPIASFLFPIIWPILRFILSFLF